MIVDDCPGLSCNWEGADLPEEVLDAAKLDGDFIWIGEKRMLSHEAYHKWLADFLSFIPKTQAQKDAEEFHDNFVGSSIIRRDD